MLLAALRRNYEDLRARELLDLVLRARFGGPEAYLEINGFITSSTGAAPAKLRYDACQERILRALAADLFCRSCGKPHGRIIYGRAFIEGQGPRTPPVRCPHCGCEDAAGPLRHLVLGAKGPGKSEILKHLHAFRLGRMALTGRRPRTIIVRANDAEGLEALADVGAILSRPMHALVFGRATVPMVRHPAESLVVEGWRAPVSRSYGARQLPNGRHPDLADWDDACTMRTSEQEPGVGRKITQKFTGTFLDGNEPWAVLNVVGNPCAEGDANHRALELAKAHPDEWSHVELLCGGHDTDPPFWSCWPEGLSSEELKRRWETDAREYDRVYRAMLYSPGEIVFDLKKARGFLAPGPLIDPALAGESGALVLPDVPAKLPWPKILAFDLGFTGPRAVRRLLKGRSKTGMACIGMHPDTKVCYVFYSGAEYIPPGGHADRAAGLSVEYNTTLCAMEIEGAQKEVVEKFEARGLMVYPYSASALGAKDYRKLPVATALNEGRLLLRCVWAPAVGHSPGGVVFDPAQTSAREAMGRYPAESDELDAIEIGCRTLWMLYGAIPTAARPAVQPVRRWLTPQEDLEAWRNSWYETPAESRFDGYEQDLALPLSAGASL
jgi:hypothetical protein